MISLRGFVCYAVPLCFEEKQNTKAKPKPKARNQAKQKNSRPKRKTAVKDLKRKQPAGKVAAKKQKITL